MSEQSLDLVLVFMLEAEHRVLLIPPLNSLFGGFFTGMQSLVNPVSRKRWPAPWGPRQFAAGAHGRAFQVQCRPWGKRIYRNITILPFVLLVYIYWHIYGKNKIFLLT